MYLIPAMFWAGYNDIQDDGWRNELTGKVLNREDGFWPWLVSEPNGGTLENCACVVASQNGGRGGWNDYMCFETTKGFCKIQPRPRLILRGKIQGTYFPFIGQFFALLQDYLRILSDILITNTQWLQTNF